VRQDPGRAGLIVASVTIILTDDDGDLVDVSVDFGAAAAQDDSPAHQMACGMLADYLDKTKGVING